MTQKSPNKPLKIAVTGVNGRLGYQLVKMGCFPLPADILDIKAVSTELEYVKPDVVIHCAAVSNVDECEISSPSILNRVNGVGVGIVRNNHQGRMIYISTDYIFDGKNGPYSENSPPNPINSYGMSKLFGEEIFNQYGFRSDTIVRTTILYGNHHEKRDFVFSVLENLRSGIPFEVTSTLFGNPTYVPHLAEALIYIANMKDPPKVVNVSGDGVYSRYEFALMIANVFGYDPKLVQYTRSSYGIAHRPRKAGFKLDLAKKLGIPIYKVVDGLRALKEETESVKQ